MKKKDQIPNNDQELDKKIKKVEKKKKEKEVDWTQCQFCKELIRKCKCDSKNG